ncbi:MAG: helix-turn-helix domain-containing protein [Devosia sp.]
MSIKMDLGSANSRQVIAELGRRIEKIRLSRNITQAQLAQSAGLSNRTVSRLEQGDAPSMDTFVRVMLALGLASHMEVLLPDPDVRPVERMRLKGHERLRARPEKRAVARQPFRWGDEEPGND